MLLAWYFVPLSDGPHTTDVHACCDNVVLEGSHGLYQPG